MTQSRVTRQYETPPVEIQSIEYRGPSGLIKAWDFRGVRP